MDYVYTYRLICLNLYDFDLKKQQNGFTKLTVWQI